MKSRFLQTECVKRLLVYNVSAVFLMDRGLHLRRTGSVLSLFTEKHSQPEYQTRAIICANKKHETSIMATEQTTGKWIHMGNISALTRPTVFLFPKFEYPWWWGRFTLIRLDFRRDPPWNRFWENAIWAVILDPVDERNYAAHSVKLWINVQGTFDNHSLCFLAIKTVRKLTSV